MCVIHLVIGKTNNMFRHICSLYTRLILCIFNTVYESVVHRYNSLVECVFDTSQSSVFLCVPEFLLGKCGARQRDREGCPPTVLRMTEITFRLW